MQQAVHCQLPFLIAALSTYTVESSKGLWMVSASLGAVASFPLSLYDIRAGAGGFRVRKISIALLLPDDCRVSGAFRGCGGSE